MSKNYPDMLKVALQAATKATEIHRRYASAGFASSSKSSSHDKVTDADLAAEAAIVQTIRASFPDHNLLAEEGKYESSDSPFQWIIDPLDGTLNFFRGIPVHSVSIALAYEGSLVVGVVADSFRDETFAAVAGGGAFLNDRRIFASRTADYREAILISGFFPGKPEATHENLRIMETFYDRGVMAVRRFGSAALDMCYVACGRVDGFWESRLNPWDFAAATLITREAGGVVTDRQGNPPRLESGYIVASNGPFHPLMLDSLNAD
ncbi:MAG TPA: inositol monophosphatase family protein [Spirochaetia bacterium]|nr:inositol monophosphatase family protein [Spirochaetia bacterium]